MRINKREETIIEEMKIRKKQKKAKKNRIKNNKKDDKL